jgi:hypothetical protein
MTIAVFWDFTPWAVIRTVVSEERIASIIKVTTIGELGTTLAVTSNGRTLLRKISTGLNEARVRIYSLTEIEANSVDKICDAHDSEFKRVMHS